MKPETVELRHVSLPLVAPFRTATGSHDSVDKVLVRAVVADAEGWGECPVGLGPGSLDSVDAAFAPAPSLPAPLAGAVETARLDAQLRADGRSLAEHLGATRDAVDVGVAIGIAPGIDELLDEVGQRIGEGYRRIKLKIQPGWDVEPVAAVRERFGNDVALHVDGNGAYERSHAEHLAELDRFGLLMLEQPLPAGDVDGHAELARRVRTPICLDESITSDTDLDQALMKGACSIVNIKPARLGGVVAAKRVHDRCVAADVPVWCGGMLETGIGRAANLALAALPGFTLPSDLSASDRYFATDLTEPFELENGRLTVPTGPGIGITPLPDVLDAVARRGEVFQVL